MSYLIQNNYNLDLYSIQLLRYSCIIETIYQNINIKKAIIVLTNDIIIQFSQLLKYLDHNVTYYKNLNQFLKNYTRLLVINYFNFNQNIDLFLNDTILDTIFIIDNSNHSNIIDKFKIKKNIIIFNL